MAKASSDAVRKCLLAWKADRARDKRVRAMGAATLRRWGLRGLAKALGAWAGHARERVRARRLVVRLAARRAAKAVAPAFRSWLEDGRARDAARALASASAAGRVDAADALTTLGAARDAAEATLAVERAASRLSLIHI